ncbi:MAG: PH domain-containing protein [Pseudomonadales bacterium]|nr:PH domain-containing protein [Pseudomonadales bacterium]
MSKPLADTRFLKDIRLTENEHIVWQGGADRSGITIELLRGVLSLIVIVAFFTFFFHFDELLFIDNPEYTPPAKEQTQTSLQNKTQSKNTDGETIKVATEKAKPASNAAKNTIPAIIPNTPFLWLMGISVSLAIVFGGAIMAWLKIRNYWFVVTSERVCIQSGIINIQVVTIDLDKIVSIIVAHSFWDRLFNTHSIEVIHPGGKSVQPNGLNIFNPYRIQYVSNSQQLPTELLSHWLPRDNGGRG